MTTAQKKSALAMLAALAIPVFTALISIGAARQELSGKEDREAHATDMRMMLDTVREERRIRQLQEVHDSAFRAVLLERVTDASCDRNPARRYCR